MSRDEESVGEVPGWVILPPGALPDTWRSRAIPMVLVALTPVEADQLLSRAPVEQAIGLGDLPLVRLVARGHSAAEIARTLAVSPRTVHRRVARLADEFAVSTIQELAAELARRGF